MENLNIDGGAVSLTIDGDKNRIIRFYPTDLSFVEGFYDLASTFDAMRADVEKREREIMHSEVSRKERNEAAVALRREVFETMRDGIDRVFGEGTSQTVFGNHDNLTMAARFFRGVAPYIHAARLREIERYTKDTGDVMDG